MRESGVHSWWQWFLLICAALFCTFHHAPTFAAEADWVYQAADLLRRFEEVGASKEPLPNKEVDYVRLLDDCAKFSVVPEESVRAARARKVVCLLMQSRINEQLGNVARMKRAAEDYEKSKAALPPEEKNTLVLLFERNGAGTTPFAPRSCTVEAKGNEIKVTAVDYPIDELLKRMAAAVGKGVRLPPEVSGVVDFDRREWTPADAAVYLVLIRHGLFARGDVHDAYAVMVQDRLYLASLAEKCGKLKSPPKAERVEEGIDTGYAIVSGCYIKPPYKVEVRSDETRCKVCINGMPLGKGFRLVRAPTPPPIPGDKPFTLEHRLRLCAYVNQTYVKVAMTDGHDAAMEAVGRVLEEQKVVKSWKYDKERNRVSIRFTDGDEEIAILPWPAEIERAKAKARIPPDAAAEHFRKRGLAQAEKQKAEIEGVLSANGLVLAPTGGMVFANKSEKAEEKLRAIAYALQQIYRQQEKMSQALFDLPSQPTRTWSWEILFNLRHRVLIQRLRAAGLI